ncbi:MAG: hypothetical protein J6A92_07065 [Lachnospiraceae bacterium]|nr:hypothetical protein [Lachnospiraceae bacterium]
MKKVMKSTADSKLNRNRDHEKINDERMENQWKRSDMIPIQKIHGEHSREYHF